MEREKTQEWLLKHADDIIGRLLNEHSDITEDGSNYYQSSAVLKADKWSKYYNNEPNGGQSDDVVKDINNL